MIENQFIPNHVAIILDGNRRWAKSKGVPFIEGYRRSHNRITEIARHLWSRQVKSVTIWGFSTENWKRSSEEIGHLMELFLSIDSHIAEFVREEVKVTHLGRKDRLPGPVIKKIRATEEATSMFDKFELNIAIDYGGHDELIRACNDHLKRFPDQEFSAETIAQCLDTSPLAFPEPDLIIRTGGELRLSGFMSWQSAYSELAFVDDFLPDLTTDRVDQLLEDFGKRKRRFGK